MMIEGAEAEALATAEAERDGVPAAAGGAAAARPPLGSTPGRARRLDCRTVDEKLVASMLEQN